jgi:hypothetical protein
MLPTEIRPETLAAGLLDSGWRAELCAALAAEQGSNLPLNHAFSAAAPAMVTSPDQLRDIVERLLAEGRDELVDELVFHEQMPEDVLLSLCEAGRCVSALGHRGGPRRLLERVIELHGYAEAILTLGLDLYRDASVDAAVFEAFLERHRDHAWLRRTLAGIDPGDDRKRAAYASVIASVR